MTLRSSYIDFSMATGNHYTSAPLSPLVTGEPGGPYDNFVTGPDTTYAFGFCPDYADFDVIDSFTADRWLIYEGWETVAAALGQTTMNPNSQPVTVALWGFSYHTIRDDRPTPEIDRSVMLRQTLEEMGLVLPIPSAVRTPATNALAQNVPNPFNPTTTIAFSIKERAPVTLRIYNVRGQRVKTLVNDTREPGVTHRIEWDGRNDAGQQVASGVYFYRLVSNGFVKTRKMVLLK